MILSPSDPSGPQPLTRRDFLRRLMAAGLALPALGAGMGQGPPAVPGGAAPSPRAAASPIDRAAGGIAVVAVSASPTAWDLTKSTWSTWQGVNYLYDRLLTTDEAERLQPALATEWTVSDDGLTYTLTLRRNVRFHDGTPFNAEAVKFNVERHQQRDDSSFNQTFRPVDRVEVVDDHTVRIVLNELRPNFLYDLTGWGTTQISPTAARQLGDRFGTQPVGTGPFKFRAYEPDSHIDYVRNADYWGGAPALDGLRVRIIPEANVRLTELQAKTIDVVHGVDAKDVESLRRSGITVEQRVAPGAQFISLNVSSGPTAELAVRKAIARAVDRDTMIQKVLFGLPEKSRAGVPSASPYYHADVPMIEYDPVEAGRILDEAGWVMGSGGVRQRNGQPLRLNILSTEFGTVGNYGLFNQIIQEQLKEIGIDSEITSYEWGTYLDHWREVKSDWHLTWHSQGGLLFSAATNVMNAAWQPTAFWTINQIRRSTDPELMRVAAQLNELETKLKSTLRLEDRKPLAREAQQLYQDYQLTVWLWHLPALTAVNPRLKDYRLVWTGRVLDLTAARVER